ncbi:MAG: S-adenosylmethionine:tRNA ribosyltransferase-isomerase, partial [Sphingomonadaceae bacterium]|nr:S-adenosylmethionine:tRNA ribosyltransferase-isomerase [Sphingomonadaceae bacterium]
MRVDLFDFELPEDRIALRPSRPRDAARLLVLEGKEMKDKHIGDLPGLLRAGDCLVFNDTRVIPARLEGRRGTARIGATLHKREGHRSWRAFVKNSKRLSDNDEIVFEHRVKAVARERGVDGSWLLSFAGDEPVEHLLQRAGAMPLPPY